MFTRFKMNVQRFPRTFVVLCLAISATLLANYGMGRAVGIDARRVSLYILASVAAALVIDGFLYKWFMDNSERVNSLLSILGTFEGRKACGGDPAPENDIDYEEGTGCGDSECTACNPVKDLWADEQGQDIAEYAVMLAVILVIALGTIRLIGSNAANVISAVGSQIQ